MATTVQRPPDAANGDPVPSQHPENNENGRKSSSRQKHAGAGQTQKHSSRSFSERAKNLPPDWMDKPLPPEPFDSLEDDGYSTPTRRPHSQKTPAPAPQDDSPRDESTPPTIPNSQQTTPVSRAGTVRSKDQRGDWASDRSPLQKLEVTLTGISKEEKRARVMEAELQLKERMERQNTGDNDHNQSSSPAQRSASTTRESAKPRAATSQKTRTVRDAQEASRSKEQQYPTENVHSEKPDTAHRRESSFRYGQVPPSGELNYVKPSTAQAVAIGTAPRRAVSVSHRPQQQQQSTRPANRNSIQEVPKRTVSQLDPVSVPPRKAVPGQVDTSGIGQPRAPYPDLRPVQQRASYTPGMYPKQDAMVSGAIQQPGGGRDLDQTASSESTTQSKPKRQTVSFNVPPPTPPPLSEWKGAPVARLCLSDFEFQSLDVPRGKAWWEGGTSNRRRSRGLPNTYQPPVQKPKPKCKHPTYHCLFKR